MPSENVARKFAKKVILHFGGRCQRCDYDRCIEALECHHFESSEKDFGISSKGYTRSWNQILKELEKCVLLCANCHREVHAGLQLPQETVVEKSGEFREAFPAFVTNSEWEP